MINLAEMRVLKFLDITRNFVALIQVEYFAGIEDNDIESVPGLVIKGLVEHSGHLEIPAIRITEAGITELRDMEKPGDG